MASGLGWAYDEAWRRSSSPETVGASALPLRGRDFAWLIAHQPSSGRGRRPPMHPSYYFPAKTTRLRVSSPARNHGGIRGPEPWPRPASAAVAFRCPRRKLQDPCHAGAASGVRIPCARIAAFLRSATRMACRLATRRGKIPRRRAGELLAAEIDELAQRQAHDAGGATLQTVYESVFRILQSVSAGLIPSPSRIGVRLHLVLRERAEGQARTVDKGAALPCMRVDDAKAAMHGVRRRAQQRQVRQGRFRVLGFAQDAALYIYRSVRAHNQGFPLPVLLALGGQGSEKGESLARGQPRDHGWSRLARRPVFRHGNGTYGHRPCQGLKQFPATRAGRGQKQSNAERHAQPADAREAAPARNARSGSPAAGREIPENPRCQV